MTPIVVLFLEGATEVEFYARLIGCIREQNANYLPCKVLLKDVCGIGEYGKKVVRIFEKVIKPKYSGACIRVGLCYDSDVFEFSQHPPVEWESVVKELKTRGAQDVQRIIAKTSIEDWFLLDPVGLRKFLRLSRKEKVENYKGCKGLQDLFLKSGKVYVKGSSCKGLIEHLDLTVIMPRIPQEVNTLKKLLGITGNGRDRV